MPVSGNDMGMVRGLELGEPPFDVFAPSVVRLRSRIEIPRNDLRGGEKLVPHAASLLNAI